MIEPRLVDRPDRPYAAIPVTVTMTGLGELAPPLIGEVAGWLGGHGLDPVGAPFFRYRVVDMAAVLQLEVGFPTDGLGTADGRVLTGVLPGGRYATVVHIGPPAELAGVTAELIGWAADRELRWDMRRDGPAERWAARLEHHLTDPAEEPDPAHWRTELDFRLAD